MLPRTGQLVLLEMEHRVHIDHITTLVNGAQRACLLVRACICDYVVSLSHYSDARAPGRRSQAACTEFGNQTTAGNNDADDLAQSDR